MYYEMFQTLCREYNVKPIDVSRATGISTATLTSWKKGKYTPKQDKLQLIADFFGVSLETFVKGDIREVPERIERRKRTEDIEQRVTEAVRKALEDLPDGQPGWYTDPETAKEAQRVFDDPDLRMLFDAARDSRPENIRLAAEMLRRFKETNPDG